MGKIKYNGILFDSQLEVDYYNYLVALPEVIKFIYHPKKPISVTSKNSYTPDFIVEYDDRIEIVETKGYNQFSFMRDNMIHNIMLNKSEDELRNYVISNGINPGNKHVVYKKYKQLKSLGFVDFDFKNPNTIANKRKNKITELSQEIKTLKERNKDLERFKEYKLKDKLTKTQRVWLEEFENKEKNICGIIVLN